MIHTFEGIKNARDLGGLQTSDGKKVKQNLLLRSAELSQATKGDVSRLAEEFSIRHVIDFRDKLEQSEKPDCPVPGSKHYSLPALPPMQGDDGGEQAEAFKRLLYSDPVALFQGVYRELSQTAASAGAYRQFFRILLAAEGEPVLWHCTQGKDRTGVAAILLLHVLGVSMETAKADYFLTNEVMRPEFENAAKQLSPEEAALLEAITFVREDCLRVYLDHITEKYGSMADYIHGPLGVTCEEVRKLKAWYTE